MLHDILLEEQFDINNITFTNVKKNTKKVREIKEYAKALTTEYLWCMRVKGSNLCQNQDVAIVDVRSYWLTNR